MSLTPRPVLLALARKWWRPSVRRFTIQYWEARGLIPPPVVNGNQAAPSMYEFRSVVAVKVMCELRRRGIGGAHYAKALKRLWAAAPDLSRRKSLRFVMNGDDVVIIASAKDETGAWKLADPSKLRRGEQRLRLVHMDVDILSIREDIAKAKP